MRFRLRTLLIVLALGPPAIAVGWWGWGRLFPQVPQPVHHISYSCSGAGPGHLFIDGKEYPVTLMDDPKWQKQLKYNFEILDGGGIAPVGRHDTLNRP